MDPVKSSENNLYDPFSLNNIAAFRNIFEQTCVGMILLDHSGTILVCNKTARKLLNKTKNQLIEKQIWTILPSFWKDIQSIFKSGNPLNGKKINIPPHSIIANQTPIFHENQIIGILSIFQNINEYEKLASELKTYKDLHEELKVIINSSYDGIWISDAEGRAVRINPASERLTGVNANEMIGRDLEEIVNEGYFDKSVTLEVLKQKKTVTLIQNTKAGKKLMCTGNPVFDEKGKIRLVVSNARDATELKRLQDELEKSRALTDKYRSELIYTHQNELIDTPIISHSKSMKKVINMAMKVSQVDSSVLIQGESGVGKSLIARMIHKGSPRCDKPLIQLDCGGIPASLIEAELFGYVRGAFTGARREGRPGYFELAEGGSLFLDEIGELPLNTQVKLLRFLEDNEVVRLGDIKPRKLDVRIIAATNRNLEKMIKDELFRKDLFFRLNVVPLTIPPLRDRREDIPLLIDHFIKINNEKCSSKKSVSNDMLECICQYKFPGNVRELANIIERLVILSSHQIIDEKDLPQYVQKDENKIDCILQEDSMNLSKTVERVESELILRCLNKYGSQREAAKYLGINHSTLSRKAKQYGISVEKSHQINKNAT